VKKKGGGGKYGKIKRGKAVIGQVRKSKSTMYEKRDVNGRLIWKKGVPVKEVPNFN